MTVRTADDVVDVLLSQHEQLRQLITQVQAAAGSDRRRLFGELLHLLHAHEVGERIVVRPAVRDHTYAGGIVAVACGVEADLVGRAAAELQDLGSDHPAFGAKFTVFRQAVLGMVEHEEREEFPRLRQYLPAQRLHMMANQLRNVQTMS